MAPASLRVTDTHHLLRSWCRESSRSGREWSGRDPLRVASECYCPGTMYYSPAAPAMALTDLFAPGNSRQPPRLL